MKPPVWLLKDVLLALHEQSLGLFGGLAGVRDEAMLDSALQRPLNLAAYGEPTDFELAAAYAFGLAKNHPFFDGNKRAAFLAAVTFLESNGHAFRGSEVDAVLKTLALAAGELDEAGYAAWLAENTTEPTR